MIRKLVKGKMNGSWLITKRNCELMDGAGGSQRDYKSYFEKLITKNSS